ncbi:sialate O-acetylesterase [Rhizosphaericola mali]|uniref:Sialate O-acetylesterase n=1 Tax=Rhizosphaericola mali TaxID=2545455 RepID=A0A5P2GB90_9BACT|nr:sialate O-acetylesterase [Rhizosphaericola mali]
MPLKIIFLIVYLNVIQKVSAQLKVPGLFSNNMVLQQKSNPPIWGWCKPNEKVEVFQSWNKQTVKVQSDDNGKWIANLSTPTAGGPYFIQIKTIKEKIEFTNVMIGEVWLCTGQSNMEMPMKGFRDQPILHSTEDIVHSKNQLIRFIKIPRSSQTTPQDSAKYSNWQAADPSTVSNFSATGYYFARELQKALETIPVGLINVSYGGSKIEAWMDSSVLASMGQIVIPHKGDSIKSVNQTPTVLFNGMLKPVIGYGIKGCIWYQGESNYDDPKAYEKLLPLMTSRWRSLWGTEFPFFYAQIAPFNYASLPPYYSGGKYNSAYLRDAQRKSLKTIPNSGMITLMDIGEAESIHPMHKKEGGERLAYLSLNKTYELKGFPIPGPTFDSMTIAGNIATIKLLNAPNGITSYGKPLQLFEIAGADKTFFPAQAVISQGKIKVSSPYVSNPVAVRYAFKDFIVGELYNTEGFPVSSFRTDDWDY